MTRWDCEMADCTSTAMGSDELGALGLRLLGWVPWMAGFVCPTCVSGAVGPVYMSRLDSKLRREEKP